MGAGVVASEEEGRRSLVSSIWAVDQMRGSRIRPVLLVLSDGLAVAAAGAIADDVTGLLSGAAGRKKH